jgi:hypothetical protein
MDSTWVQRRQDPALLCGLMLARLPLSLMLAVTSPADEAELRAKAALLLNPATALHRDDVLALFQSALIEEAVRLSVRPGTLDPTEPTLAGLLQSLVVRRDLAREARDRAIASSAAPIDFDAAQVAAFTQELRRRLMEGDVAARKLWLTSIINRIEVSREKIRVIVRNDNFERGLKNRNSGQAPVRSSVQEWCPGTESNRRHCDFQSHALPTELPGRAGREALKRERAFRQSRAGWQPPVARKCKFMTRFLGSLASALSPCPAEGGYRA